MDGLIHIKEIVVVLRDHLIHAYYGHAVYKASHNEAGEIHETLKRRLEESAPYPALLKMQINTPEMSVFKYLYQASLSNCAITICRMMDENKNYDTFFDVLKKVKKLDNKPEKLDVLNKKINEFKASEEFRRIKQFRHRVIAHNAKHNIPMAGIKDIEFCLDVTSELVDLCIEIFFVKSSDLRNRRTLSLVMADSFWSKFVEGDEK